MNVRPGAGEREFLLVEGGRNVVRLARSTARRLIRANGKERTPDLVRANYDTYRSGKTITDLDSFIYGDSSALSHVLLNDRVCWAKPAEVNRKFLDYLGEIVIEYAADVSNATVVEFGSGSGRNILYLKKRFPQIRCIGLELSPVSVELARSAVKQLGIEAEFYVADVTKELPKEVPSRATMCYSVHALEQMPGIFRQAVKTMMDRSDRATIFFEPVSELFPRTFRGLVGRMRVKEHEYLDGLYKHLQEIGAPVKSAKRLTFALNPLNETVEIRLVYGAAG